MDPATTLIGMMKSAMVWLVVVSASAVITKFIEKGLEKKWNQEEDDEVEQARKLEALLLDIERALGAASERIEGFSDYLSFCNEMRSLRDAVHEAEDILDLHEYKRLEKQMEGKNENTVRVPSSHIDIHRLIDRLKSFKDGVSSFTRDLNPESSQGIAFSRETSSLESESALFGREKEINLIFEMMFFEKYHRFGVLPIVGMAGVGKTTLARHIFNHELVKQEFPVRLWVCASGTCDVIRLTMEMIKPADSLGFRYHYSLNRAQDLLQNALKEQRFLLVLDDLCKVTEEFWEELCKPFRTAERRSMVVVTTQLSSIAARVGTMEPVKLEPLDMEDYWPLFKHYAFGDVKSKSEEDVSRISETSEGMSPLEQAGFKIAERMNGLPLAAKALGRALNHRMEEDHWRTILESELWMLKPADNSILPALWMSFNHLDAHLKTCFAYCSIFPRGYCFNKDKLIQMWMAQGLIHSNGGRRLEDIGSQYFEDLIDRSFFQPASDNKRYIMHNLIRELAQAVSLGESFIFTDDSESIPLGVRHLTVMCSSDLTKLMQCMEPVTNLRTLLVFGEYSYDFLNVILHHLRSIRVLDVSEALIEIFSSNIGDLVHLRYLDLSGSTIVELESLCRLYLLQTLNVRCTFTFRWPTDLSKFISLRHLYADVGTISRIPQIGRLTNMQELEEYSAGGSSGIDALQSMTELRGNLHIMDLHLVKDDEARKEILKESKHLTSLQLSWGSGEQSRLDKNVLECFQPHDNLKNLRINGYGDVTSPLWMLEENSLSNVRSVYLSDCKHWKILPPLDLLPRLEVLEIKGMHAVINITSQLHGRHSVRGRFPRLKKLVFEDMPNWEEWAGVDDGKFLPCLCELEVRNCPKLERFPLLPPVEKVTIENVGLIALPEFFVDSESEVSLRGSSSSSTLSSMYIAHCPNLRSLGGSLYSEQQIIRFALKLTITDCESLGSSSSNAEDSLPKRRKKSEGEKNMLFSYICELEIRNCPNLSTLPHLPPNLTTLTIENVGLKALPKIGEGFNDSYQRIAEGGSSSSSFTSSSLSYSSSLSILRISSCLMLSSISTGIEISRRHMLKQKQSAVQKSLPFPHLSILEISNCPMLTILPDIPLTLTKLRIENVGLEELPEIWEDFSIQTVAEGSSSSSGSSQGSPSSLSTLYISCCTKLNSLSIGFLQQQHLLRSLEHLTIRKCENLKSDLDRGFKALKALRKFTLHDCPRLMIYGFPTSLKTLEIDEYFVVHDAWPNEVPFLFSISDLKISGCSLVGSDEECHLKSLDWLRYLSDLKSLYVENTLFLTFHLFDKLTSLDTLEIDGCLNFFTDLGQFWRFTKLRYLSIRNCKLPYLPEDLKSLPSLMELCIDNCPLITSLPQNGLPCSLKVLSIYRCNPSLQQRCQNKTGELKNCDWWKISHIPCIFIEGKRVE
ncbi:putative disease resistance protein RGA3 [Typha angustifolia]|uniref:putative disease resistance protein RGA3 n=1 Tax=Typha angustifolia TaxID=59011 RepID=UPI003C2B1E16